MTYQGDITLPKELLKEISEQCINYLPELIRILVNAAMQAERQENQRMSVEENVPTHNAASEPARQILRT